MGRKDFNKGMEAGARPFEEKFRQEQKRNQEWKQTFEEKFDNLKETNEAILDEMESREKEKFYKLHTIVDIKTLEKGDRETLLSLLFTLGETQEEVTELQQLFLRSVKKYLENEKDKKPTNWSVLKDGDWSVVESICGIDETKAIAQAVMEFLFLGYGSHEAYMEDYEDLFECFNLNKRGFGEIREQIDLICRGTGLQGLAEMYGYVPEEDDVEDESMQNVDLRQYGAHGKLEELKVSEEIILSDGEERVFENKKIIFEKGIKGRYAKDNKLIFKNCEILVQEESALSGMKAVIGTLRGQAVQQCDHDKRVIISGLEKGVITFENCTITNGKSVLIECANMKLTIKDSYLNGSAQIYQSSGKSFASIRHCYINLLQDREIENLFLCGQLEMFDTFVYGEQEKDGAWDFHLQSSSHSLFESNTFRIEEGRVYFENCGFYHLPDLLLQAGTEVNGSVFEDCCVKICERGWQNYGLFSNCEFQNCIFAEAYGTMNFDDVKLLSCVGILPAHHMKDVISDGGFLSIWGVEDLALTRCQFSNWFVKSCENMVDKNGKSLFTYSHSNFGRREQEAVIVASGANRIIGCRFENLDLGERYLIGGSHADGICFDIINCHFENISTGSKEIFRKEFHYMEEGFLRDKEITEKIHVRIENCTGL